MIMDGNGRWAQRHGLPRLKGHEAGAETVRRVIRFCRDAGIRYLTLYAFSKENWSRPVSEVNGLMRLLQRSLKEQESEFHRHRLRLRAIGCREDWPAAVRRQLTRIEEATRDYQEGTLVIALSYGGRAEIVQAARRLALAAGRGDLDPSAIDEDSLASRLYAPDVPDPDLIVRTSGEQRISNFLLWQAAYSELYFTPVAWPDFSDDDFRQALAAYATRKRRFGGLENHDAKEGPPC